MSTSESREWIPSSTMITWLKSNSKNILSSTCLWSIETFQTCSVEPRKLDLLDVVQRKLVLVASEQTLETPKSLLQFPKEIHLARCTPDSKRSLPAVRLGDKLKMYV